MNSAALIPNWLSIVRVDDRRYQLIDNSVASIGFCLGIFPCREAAESLAAKIANSRVFKPASTYFKPASTYRVSTETRRDEWRDVRQQAATREERPDSR